MDDEFYEWPAVTRLQARSRMLLLTAQLSVYWFTLGLLEVHCHDPENIILELSIPRIFLDQCIYPNTVFVRLSEPSPGLGQ